MENIHGAIEENTKGTGKVRIKILKLIDNTMNGEGVFTWTNGKNLQNFFK